MKLSQTLPLSLMLGLTTAAQAQVRDWATAANGNWSVAGNWSGTNVPDSAAETANIALAGTYIVTDDVSVQIGGLTLTDPNATLNVNGGISLALAAATATNNGLIVINTAAANSGTLFRLDVPACTLGGTGTIRLNANPVNLDTAYLYYLNGTYVLTSGASQKIAGTGRVYVGLVNDGIVDADASGKTLEMLGGAKTNNNIMRATNGGNLQFSSNSLTNTTGQVSASGAGSTIWFISSSISGGALSGTSGGVVNSYNSTLSDVTLSGQINAVNNSSTYINGSGITNNGTITVNPAGANQGTLLRLDAAAGTIGGTGIIRLNANAANLDTAYLYENNGGNVLTLGANQTVAGTGRIYVNTVNNGLIDADTAGTTLELTSQPKTNNGTMRARNGATLQFISISIGNSAGQISADGSGSSVNFNGCTLSGGTLSTTNSAVASGINSTLSDVTLSGQFNVSGNASVGIAGNGITNNGQIVVNPTGANVSTVFRLDVAAATIGGNGTVRLKANSANLDTAYLYETNGTYVLTLGAGQLLDGTGRIYVNTTNNGTINADVTGAILELTSQPKTNNGIIEATNGGTLQINGPTISNAAGQLQANGAGSILNALNCTVSGGQLSTSLGGLIQTANTTLSNVTLAGNLNELPNYTLNIGSGGLTNNGFITINPTAANQLTYLQLTQPTATIGGTGTILLNANSANLDTGLINTVNGTYVLTLAAGQTLAGLGRVSCNITNQGTLSPGSTATPVGQIDIVRPWTQQSSAILAIDLGGTAATQYDRLTGSSTVTLGGNLNVTKINGFNPVMGNDFTIVTAAAVAGKFAHVTAPALPAGSVWRVRYTPTTVVLAVTCPADLDGDHVIGLGDLSLLLSHYGTANPNPEDGDLDVDGDIDLPDLSTLLSKYGTTCP